MEHKKSFNKRRLGVIITFLCILGIVLIFEYGITKQWSSMLKTGEFALIIVFLFSLWLTYIKTGLWKFTHKSLGKLDEREVLLTSKSLRYAYGIFTLIVLGLLLSFSIIEKPINIVLVVSLIFTAHILPASIIAWTEKSFEND